MKMIIKTSLTLSVLASANLMGATFYSQETEMRYPARGPDWNKATDGSSDAGVSSTYGAAANDIVIQNGHTLITDYSSGLTFGAKSYQLESGASLQSGSAANATTFNSDIQLTDTHSWKIESSAAVIQGSGSLILDTHTVNFHHAYGSSSGSLDLGLNVVGSGTLSGGFSNSTIDHITFSGLTTDFTGTLNFTNSNDINLFLDESNTSSANLIIGQSGSATKITKLMVQNTIQLDSLYIQGQEIAVGTYTVTDLTNTYGDSLSNNLTDLGGTIYVGVAVPEPSTSALFGLAGLTLLARRRFRFKTWVTQ